MKSFTGKPFLLVKFMKVYVRVGHNFFFTATTCLKGIFYHFFHGNQNVLTS